MQNNFERDKNQLIIIEHENESSESDPTIDELCQSLEKSGPNDTQMSKNESIIKPVNEFCCMICEALKIDIGKSNQTVANKSAFVCESAVKICSGCDDNSVAPYRCRECSYH